MSITMYKFHCSGNDILIIPYEKEADPLLWSLLAHRRLGVGSDQCIVIRALQVERSLLEVEIFNPDGSTSGRCINGMLCLGSYLQSRYPDIHRWFIRSGECVTEINNQSALKVHVSQVNFQLQAQDNVFYAEVQTWLYEERRYFWAACDVGNPHAIIDIAEDPYGLADEDFMAMIQRFLRDIPFDQGINVSLVYRQPEVLDVQASIRLRTFERGAGETLACGSAAMACVAVINMFFNGPRQAQVCTRFDSYEVTLDHEGVWLTGRAQAVFETMMKQEALEQGLILYQQLQLS